MAAGVPARLTPRPRAAASAFTVGGAFLVFAAIAWWRGTPDIAAGPRHARRSARRSPAWSFPTYLGPVERAWMGLAHTISKVTTPIVMGVMYLVVLTPVGLLCRTLGGNPLEHRAGKRGVLASASRRRAPVGQPAAAVLRGTTMSLVTRDCGRSCGSGRSGGCCR